MRSWEECAAAAAAARGVVGVEEGGLIWKGVGGDVRCGSVFGLGLVGMCRGTSQTLR
jgi:hypothetical protein